MSSTERLALRIEDDGLAAFIRVEAGPRAGADALAALLAETGITTGIDAEAAHRIASALAEEVALDDALCIARGQAPRHATPDRLELLDPIGPIAGRLRADESIDYRERRLIVPVREGALLGRIVPGDPPVPGVDVHGAALPAAEAPPLAFACGDGVAREASGELRATRTGARTIDPQGRMDVVSLHVHAGIVDLDSGNLETAGSLQVQRDVASGMSVRAGADLAIKGTVDAARIEAGGSIVIGGGVIGGETGVVRAGGDLHLRHALGARLFARGILGVARSVSTSLLQAREIEIAGRMLGDQALAEIRIAVRDAGSPAGGPCHLRAAHPLDVVEGERTEPSVAREQARARLRGGDRLAARKRRNDRIGRGERPESPRSLELQRQRAWRKRQRALQPLARIVVEGTAHAGCRIDFGGRPLVLEKTVKGRTYRFDVGSGEILWEEI
ncbi:MAG: FapA family protein [Myxococcota bacterium]